MNIDEMQAGRAMDLLVEERVFGNTEPPNMHKAPLAWTRREDGTWRYDYQGHHGDCISRIWPLERATCMSNAWGIVEEMIRRGAAVNINHWDGNTCPDTIWNVIFASPGFRGEASCHTAPLAICRAALRAVRDDALNVVKELAVRDDALNVVKELVAGGTDQCQTVEN